MHIANTCSIKKRRRPINFKGRINKPWAFRAPLKTAIKRPITWIDHHQIQPILPPVIRLADEGLTSRT